MSLGRNVRIAARVLGIVLALAAAALTASQALGGPVSVVMVRGSSMEPRYHQGDLVLVRRAGSYESGDVVAYRSRQLRTIVLHRIVARDGSRFVLQGDSNSWRDPERPAAADVVGTEWIRVPAAGKLLTWLRTPQGLAAGLGGAAMTILGGYGARRRRRRRRRPVVTAPTAVGHLLADPDLRSGAGNDIFSAHPPRRGLPRRATALGVVAAASLAVALAATVAGSGGSTVAYEHEGAFQYFASVPPGAAYQKGSVETGDPVYLNVASKISVGFAYRFRSGASHRLVGRGSLIAEITDDTGWKHSLELRRDAAFAGDETVLRADLDLERVWSVIERFRRLTGVQGSSFGLTLVPTVHVDGTMASREFHDDFEARLQLRLEPLYLRVAAPETESADADPLHPRSAGTLDSRSAGGRSVLGLPLSASGLQRIALGAALASALGMALAMARGGGEPGRRDEASRILRRYRQWIVPLREPLPGGDAVTIEVTAIEGLLRLADRHGRMVLHEEREGRHAFLVHEEGTVYRYRPRGTVRDEAAEPRNGAENAADTAPAIAMGGDSRDV